MNNIYSEDNFLKYINILKYHVYIYIYIFNIIMGTSDVLL